MSSSFFRAMRLAMVLGVGTVIAGCQDAVAPIASEDFSTTSPSVMTSRGIGQQKQLIKDQYIVVFRDGVSDVEPQSKRLMANTRGQLKRTYKAGLRGFAANMTADEAAALTTDPSVAYVEQDQIVTLGVGKPADSLLGDLDALIEPTAAGDPDSPLRWTAKSVRQVASALHALGHEVSHTLVAQLLHDLGYSLQANQKTREGSSHPDRDAQFQYINAQVRRFQKRGQPVISVDTKKKELVGDFKKAGREWRPAGKPEPVRVHDFLVPEQGKAIPYGIYDLRRNEGWVSVGIDHDTASFAVNAIRRWWQAMGHPVYAGATSLLITADAGGSNGARLRLWKWELQAFANRTGLAITVSHFPPGTSKWNKIEHRLFSHIAMNWRGKPLVSLGTIVSLIGSTRSAAGLRVRSEIDRRRYASGVVVTNEQMAAIPPQTACVPRRLELYDPAPTQKYEVTQLLFYKPLAEDPMVLERLQRRKNTTGITSWTSTSSNQWGLSRS